MNYYILRMESDPAILGVQDLDQAIIDKKCFQDEKEYDKLMAILGSNDYWNHIGEIADFDFSLQCARLKKRAKLTDFLNFTPHLMNCPFLISKAVKELFSAFNLYGVNFWPANVMKGDERFGFYLVHFTDVGDGVIDFSKSTFYSGNAQGKKLLKFNDKSAKDMFVETNMIIKYDKIVLNNSLARSLDLFQLPNSQIIVSTPLKDKLDAGGYSGVKLLPAFGDVGQWLKLH